MDATTVENAPVTQTNKKESDKVVYVHKGTESPQTSGEIIQTPVLIDAIDRNIEKNISQQLTQAGHQSRPAEVTVNQSTVLKGIEDFGGEVVNDAWDSMKVDLSELSGKTTDMGKGERAVAGKHGLKVIREKMNKIREFVQGEKKAA